MELFASPVIEAAFELEEEIQSMEMRNIDSASFATYGSEISFLTFEDSNGQIGINPSWELDDGLFQNLKERRLFREHVLTYLTESDPDKKQTPVPEGSGFWKFGSAQIAVLSTEDFSSLTSFTSYQRGLFAQRNGRMAGLNFREITNRKLMRYYAIRSDGPPYPRHQVKVSDFFLLSLGERKCNPT